MSEHLSFKYNENKQRVGKYLKSSETEQFLDRLNQTLQSIEPDEAQESGSLLPLIFVVGLMRSGTTLLTQILSHTLDIACINNLIARFWLAPITGIRLSKILLGDSKDISFKSDYGKTANITEPHEFSYFWQYWLKMQNIPPYDPKQAVHEIDWNQLTLTLCNMAAEFGKPMIMKAPDISYHIKQFDQNFPEAIFVLIKRDLADIAVSLQKGRLEYYGDENVWLGSYPVEYESIKHLKGKEQIAAQVFFLDRLYTTAVEGISSERRVIIDLEQLCDNPCKVVDCIKERVFETTRCLIHDHTASPSQLRFSTYKNTEDYKEFDILLRSLQEDHKK